MYNFKLDAGESAKGLASLVCCYLLWGTLAIYWSLMFHLPNMAMVAYRLVWSWASIVILITIQRNWSAIGRILKDKKELLLLLVTGLLINLNWGTYMIAIATGHVLEASMGYYINPLLSAMLGAIFFKEAMHPLQKIAVLFATIGVGYMVIGYGSLPIFAILLALSFGTYGALHKLMKSNATQSMFFEMTYLLVPALLYLLYAYARLDVSFFAEPLSMKFIIMLTGPVTLVPLMAFNYGVKRLPLATAGIVQYLSPTTTFFVGLLFFKEPLNTKMLIVFGFVWAGVIIYLADGLIRHSRIKKKAKWKAPQA